MKLSNALKCLGLLPLSLLLSLSPSQARDLYVGRDADTPTIAHAIKLAAPGDTIHLEPEKHYRECAGFYGKKGEPEKPITLDGHGATLEGADPLDPAQWTETAPGHFTCDQLIATLNGAMLARWFFLFEGQVQRMGRASKGKSAPLKAPDELAPGEWTFVQSSPPTKDHSTIIQGTFHLRIKPGQSLADAKIAVPLRSAGVQLSGENAHLIIRHLTARHPYNDGFNIHGKCTDVVFENITAIGCGDDGISAHGEAHYRVKGFTSIGNSTGICDTGFAVTSYEDVFIADCVSVDLYFLDEGRYSLKNAFVFSSAQQPFSVNGRVTGICRLSLENIHFRRLIEPRLGHITSHASVTGARCTFEGMEIQTTGKATWHDSILNGQASAPDARGAEFSSIETLIPPHYRP